MLSGLQKLTFSVSVIAHVIVFYPYATEIKQPSAQSKTISFSLVKQVSQNTPPDSPQDNPLDTPPDSPSELSPDPVPEPEEVDEKLPELKRLEQLKQEEIVQNKTQKTEIVKKIPETRVSEPVVKKTDPEISPKSINNIKPKTKPELIAKTVIEVKNETIPVKSKPDNQIAKKIITEPVDQQTRQDYLLELINKINANKYYPKKAKRRGWQGQVKLRFSILPSGEVSDIEILESSNYRQLDKSALEAIYNSIPFEPIPPGLGLTRLDLELPIVYQLK